MDEDRAKVPGAPGLAFEIWEVRTHAGCPFHSPAFGRKSGIAPLFAILALLFPFPAAAQHFDGAKAYEYAREFVSIGPRWPTGPGHVKAEEFLRNHFQREHDQLEEDTFTANTPIGPVPMRNFIVRFPGRKTASSSWARTTKPTIRSEYRLRGRQ